MSRKSELNADKLSFTDISSNVGDIEFSEGSFTVNKPISFSNGLSASHISVSNGGTIAVSSLSNLKLAGSTSGEITVQAADTTTDYTIKMPNQQGGVSTVLTNDGAGNLSWGVGGSGGGNTFNQSLNTTDNVQFNNLSLTGTISGISNIVNGVGTDNAIVRFDTNGNTLQNSSVSISDDGNITTSSAIHFSENTNPPTGVDSTARLYASSSSLLFVKQNGDLIDLAAAGPVFVGATGITDGSSGIVPAPVQGQENYYLKGDGTWAEGGSGTSTVFTGATDISDGSSGIVPAPVQGQQDFYLKGDGTWQSTVVTVSNAANGSQTAPSYSFSSDTNTGMYRSNIDELAFTTGGTQRIRISSTGTTVSTRMLIYAGSNEIPGYSFSTDSDTGMHLNGANTLAFSTGGLLRTTISSSGIWNNGYIQTGTLGGSSTPSYTFVSNTNTGMFSPALNKIGFSCAGVKIAEIDSTGIRIEDTYRITNALGSVSAPSYTFSNDGNTGMYSPFADRLGFSTGAVSRMSINETGVVDISNRITIAAGSASAPSYSFKEQPSSGMYRAGSAVRFSSNGVFALDISSTALQPGADNTFRLGGSGVRWSEVYAATATINTSDATQKIIEGESIGLDEIMKLKPVKYRWIENGVRNHYGFLAQDIETLIKNGDFPDSGLFVKTGVLEDGNDINVKDITDETKIKQFNYGLRYTELIAPLVKAVQDLNNKNQELNEKIIELTRKVNLLESK